MDFEKTHIIVPPDVLMQEVGGESVLLNLTTEQYHGLDGVGTRIWEVIRDSTNLQSVYQTLLDEFDVEATLLRSDLVTFLNELAAHKLIEIHHA